jgi:hypothetical protein
MLKYNIIKRDSHILRFLAIRELQPPADAGFSLADFSTMKMEAMVSSET